jgi:hypothetical protein
MTGAGSEKAFQPQGDHGHNGAEKERDVTGNLVWFVWETIPALNPTPGEWM